MRAFFLTWHILLGLFAIFFVGCAYDNTDDPESLGGGCGLTTVSYGPPVSSEWYVPGSYGNRNFLSPANHLGEDIALAEGTAVHPIGPGKIVWYGPANGYGELVVVIEHELADSVLLMNGAGTPWHTVVFISIIGHVRPEEIRGGARLPWKVGDHVSAGDIIGYVNDDAHNGDGAEHVHLGIRLMSAAEAQKRDPAAWFRGYDSNSAYRGDFAAAAKVIGALQSKFANCVDVPKTDPTENSGLYVKWTAPSGVAATKIILSGRLIGPNGAKDPWKEWRAASNTSTVFAEIPAAACGGFESSVEFTQNSQTQWSCMGNGSLRGELTGLWNSSKLTPRVVSNGVGGCNLRFDVPCSGAPSAPKPNDPPQEPVYPITGNTIAFAEKNGQLALTVQGSISSALVGGPLANIGFLSIGSTETGWNTQTSPPTYFTVYNGDRYPHTINAPASVRRFNLWVGGSAGTRWFDLTKWSASGANCRVVADGFGGFVVVR